LAALLVLVTLALYWPATHCDFVNYDDPDYVTANPRIQAGLTPANIGWAFTTEQAGNWHPLTWCSLMLDVNLFGNKAAGFHFTNLALHAVNAALLFWLLWQMTGARWRSAGVAAVFAWHPVHVESVAWVAERKDVLSAGFGFLALIFYVQFTHRARRQEPRVSPKAQVRPPQSKAEPSFHLSPFTLSRFNLSTYFLLAWFCFALGLMSKPMLVTWPFVLLLLDFWPLGRFGPGRGWPLLREKIPFVILAVLTCVVTFVVQKSGGAMRLMESLPWDVRGENALLSYVRYLGKLFWPTDLAVFYPHPGYFPLEQVLLAGAVLTGISALAWIQRRRYPFLLMGWLWYLGTLVPVIGLVQVGEQAMADRYLYLPSVGILILTLWGAWELARCPRSLRWGLSVAGAAALVLCLVLTRQQLGYWRDSETLFRHALAVTDNNYTAHNNLGTALDNQGQTDPAIAQFQEALRLKPNNAEARYNLGNALTRQGRTEAALEQFQTSLTLKPDYAPAHNNLGNLLASQGQTDAAIRQFQEALRLKPDFTDAHYNLGNALLKQGLTDEAVNQFQVALRFLAGFAPAHYNLGVAFARQGRPDAAISQFQTAIRLQPDYAPAHYNLGVAFNRQGRTDAAISEFQEAIRFQPDYAIAHNSLGFILGGQGRLDEAIREFQEALRYKPDFAIAQTNLARALELKNQSRAPAPPPAKP
jgi:tetratricopeptide (TPR) repeat protein